MPLDLATGYVPGDPLELVCQCGVACENRKAMARHKKDCPITRLHRVPSGGPVKAPAVPSSTLSLHELLSPVVASKPELAPIPLPSASLHAVARPSGEAPGGKANTSERSFDEIKAELHAKAEKHEDPRAAPDAPSPEAQAAEGHEAVGSKAIPPGIAAHDAGQGKATHDPITEPELAPNGGLHAVPRRTLMKPITAGMDPGTTARADACHGGKVSSAPKKPGSAPTSPELQRVSSGHVDQQNAGGAPAGAADATALTNAAGDGKANLAHVFICPVQGCGRDFPTDVGLRIHANSHKRGKKGQKNYIGKGLGQGRMRCPSCGGIKSTTHPCKACGFAAHKNALAVKPAPNAPQPETVRVAGGCEGAKTTCPTGLGHGKAGDAGPIKVDGLKPSQLRAAMARLKAALDSKEAVFKNLYKPAPCYEAEGGNSYRGAMDG